jgi:cell division FtsZ-interacting protein ZapD
MINLLEGNFLIFLPVESVVLLVILLSQQLSRHCVLNAIMYNQIGTAIFHILDVIGEIELKRMLLSNLEMIGYLR